MPVALFYFILRLVTIKTQLISIINSIQSVTNYYFKIGVKLYGELRWFQERSL